MKKQPLIAGIELGPRRFIAAAGRISDPSHFCVQAIESVPAQGFEREGLGDALECADGITRLVRQLERAVGGRVTTALAAFPAHHVKSFNASSSIPIPEPGAGISRQDVERAIGTCRTLSLDYDRQILHAFERSFTIDGQTGVKNPIGLSGRKLGVEIHLVTALNLSVQNLTRVLNRGGLEVEQFVLPGLACAEGVLSDLDRDLGVTLVRIGDFQTEVILFDDGQVKETILISGGWDDLVENVSRAFRLPRAPAEHLLEQVRTLEENPAGAAAVPLRAGLGASVRTFPAQEVIQRVRGRVRDLLHKVQRRVTSNPVFLDCASGVVVVGHLARLEGFLEIAEEMLNVPVRLGTVKEMEVAPGMTLRSQDTVAIGLLRHGLRRRFASVHPANAALPVWLRPFDRFRRVLQEYF